MKKRILSSVLALSMLFSVAACSSQTADNPNTASKGAEAQKDQNQTEQVELTNWTTSTYMTDFQKSLDEEFMKLHPNIKINNVVKEGDPGNDFYAAVAAGNAPDFVKASFSVMDKYMEAGILEPLNSYFDAWEDKGAFDPVYTERFTKDGKLQGLVSWSAAFYLGYNKPLFEQAGIKEAPKNWEELLADAKKLSKPEQQQIGFSTLTAEWTEWYFQYFVWQAGGDLAKEDKDGKLTLTFTDPAVIKAGEFYKKLKQEGVLQSDLTLKFSDIQDLFAQGKIAMMPFAGDWVSIMVSKGMKPEDIGLALLPAGPSGKSVTTDLGQCYVINAKTSQAKKDAAWEYIKFMLSKGTLEKTAKNMDETGGVNPMIFSRTDFNLSDYTQMPKEWESVIEASKGGRLEFPGKGLVGSYVDRAVQNILTNPNVDVQKEFQTAQDNAQQEVVNAYNAKLGK